MWDMPRLLDTTESTTLSEKVVPLSDEAY